MAYTPISKQIVRGAYEGAILSVSAHYTKKGYLKGVEGGWSIYLRFDGAGELELSLCGEFVSICKDIGMRSKQQPSINHTIAVVLGDVQVVWNSNCSVQTWQLIVRKYVITSDQDIVSS